MTLSSFTISEFQIPKKKKKIEISVLFSFHFVSSSKNFNPKTIYTEKGIYTFHCSIYRWKTKTTPFALAARFINHLNVN